MRHKKKINHLGRQRGHRKAMLSNMASSLIVHKRITTTTAKAKALKIFVEPLITKAKEDTTHSRRHAFSNLQDKEATNELFREVASKVGERPGGYTRIIKLGRRLGDNADMCIIELVDFNENMLADKAAAKSSRRRRGSKKKSEETSGAQAKAPAAEKAKEEIAESDAVAEEVVAEEPKEEAPLAEDVKGETPVTEDAAEEATAVEETPAAAEAEVKNEEAAEEPTEENEDKKEE